MKAAILCNGINWTINKNTIYIYNTAVLINICRFLINVVKLTLLRNTINNIYVVNSVSFFHSCPLLIPLCNIANLSLIYVVFF